MNETKSDSACAVFEENIVVSGGFDNRNRLNTVKSYDVFADT